MKDLKILAKQTAIYGLSSTLGRFLNYLLIFLHMNVFNPSDLGVVSNLYAYFGLLIVVLTYGTETGYFRFVEKEKDKEKIYSTLLSSLFITSGLFILITLLFPESIAKAINYEHNKEYIVLFGIIIGLDTFCSIPLARLRHENKAMLFAKINIISIVINIALNLYFLLLAPYLSRIIPENSIFNIFNGTTSIVYVFIANLIASIGKFIMLLFSLKIYRIEFDFTLLKKILNYSYPILIIGIAGVINQSADKMIMPFLIDKADDPLGQLGIYAANYKLSVIMIVFIQMFRYAAEPFFFSKAKDDDANIVYAQVMKYFVLFSLVITVATVCFIDLFRLVASDEYFSGSKIVPIVLIGNVFLGIFYNLSIWYKLKDLTLYGALIAVIGSIVNIALNIVLVPKIGYMGAAYACISGYFIIMIIAYIWGQKVMRIDYPVKEITYYFLFALSIIITSRLVKLNNMVLNYAFKTILFFIFTGLIFYNERKIFFEIIRSRYGRKSRK
ncbi:MAG: polysaccharide biosynthesis protein [Bacteroidales bacterium]|nr:polysaccharide biosynthesis protein [Bacteroidales bacterium]